MYPGVQVPGSAWCGLGHRPTTRSHRAASACAAAAAHAHAAAAATAAATRWRGKPACGTELQRP